jgi:hypothetical protein
MLCFPIICSDCGNNSECGKKRQQCETNEGRRKKWIDGCGNERWTDETGKEFWTGLDGVTHWSTQDECPPPIPPGKIIERSEIFGYDTYVDLFEPDEPVQCTWTDSFIEPFKPICFCEQKRINDEYEEENPMLPGKTNPSVPPDPIPGCMDPLATNYNANATVSDGSCVYPPDPIPGCMDPLATNYNANATVSDGSCVYAPDPIPGCMDPLATNYNANATVSDGSCVYPPPSLKQYTPLYTKTTSPTGVDFMNNMTSVSQAVSTVDSQDPDGIKWLNWSGTEWDGVPYSGYIGPSGRSSYPELCAFLKPNGGYAIRGLREKFYQVNPFSDVTAPTIAEIDAWNIEVIKHIRALVGNTTPVSNDARLYLEARWSSERKFTQYWDSDYPASEYVCKDANKNIVDCTGRAPGPCFLGGVEYDLAGGHCGDSFFPDASDRTPYIQAYPPSTHPELVTYNSRSSEATSAGWGSNRDIPWSIRLAVAMVGTICNEGIYGHAGPMIGPEAKRLYGNAWWDKGTGTTVHLRNKWADP